MLYFILRLFSSIPLALLQSIGTSVELSIYLSSSRYWARLNHYFEQMIIDKPQQYMWSYSPHKRLHGAEIAPID